MRKFVHLIAASGLLLLLAAAATGVAWADGTSANTTITNTVTLDYQVGGVNQTQLSAQTSFLVDNKVRPVAATTTATVTVTPSATDRTLVFTLTNSGNFTQGYSLTTSIAGGVGFTPTNIRIYLDDGDSTLDGGDTLYTVGTNIADIAKDGSIIVLVVADIPGSAANGQTATINLIATTLNAGTTTVTGESAGADGESTLEVVFADAAGTADSARDGKHSAQATYSVSSASLAVTKSSAVISDPQNGATDPKRIPGAVIEYTISISNSGAQNATSVVVTDVMPGNLTYSAGTLTLNSAGLTDASDADAGAYNGGTETATVNVGTVNASGGTATVTFRATID